MSTLHDAAWSGTLTYTSLQTYLEHGALINAPGGHKNVTPLAAAALAGHPDIVQLLLVSGADPDALSPKGRTALFHATTHPSRLAIVRILLLEGAQVDLADENGTTPLMNAIMQLRDNNVIHELVDNGADVNRKNKQQISPVDMAKVVHLEREIRPFLERNRRKGSIIDHLVSVVLLAIAWVNSGVLVDGVKGIAKKLYGISGERNQELEKHIPAPTSARALANNVDAYVRKTGLDTFFPPGDRFLYDLCEKAAALRDDRTTRLGRPENIQRLTFLAMYQTVIYCDDSTSMSLDQRYLYQREVVKCIARIATRILPDEYGVELRFINANSTLSGKTEMEIDAAVDDVSLSRGTMIGTNLVKRVLKPLVYDVIKSGRQLDRPFLICTITDGEPAGEQPDTFKNAIVECKRFLAWHGYQPRAVMFCISQIGNSPGASGFLDGLRGDREIEDVIYCPTEQLDAGFKKQQKEPNQLELWLLKFLTAPLMLRYSE
ncbi:hypothetical protein FRC17_000323 [Serendipita sp. 399]|nr:hypothetical protein FRC17_000323 [Serendipita sp. 399]